MSPTSPVTAENIEHPALDLQMETAWSSLQNTFENCNSTDQNSRYKQRSLDVGPVSLSIEDELKKPDVKVISIREKPLGAPSEGISGAHPRLYHNEQKFVVLRTVSNLPKNLPVKQKLLWSPQSRRPAKGGHWGLHTNDCTKDHSNSRNAETSSSESRSKTSGKPSSSRTKFNIQFLSADGSQQTVEIGKEEDLSTDKKINSEGLKRTFLKEKNPRSKFGTALGKAEGGHVGPVINGMNPKTTSTRPTTNNSSFSLRAEQLSKLSGPSNVGSSAQRPRSVVDTQNWSYITITKPLSPPEGHLSSLHTAKSITAPAPDFVKVTPRPRCAKRRENSPETLTARPVILETRRDRSSPQCDMDLETQILKPDEGRGEAKGKACEEGVIPDGGKVKVANEEQALKSLFTVVHQGTMPVISIPTAQTDISE